MPWPEYIKEQRDFIEGAIRDLHDLYAAKRAIEQKGLDPATAEKEVKLIDKRRAKHYNTFTERTWGNRIHYDLLINSSLVGVEKTAQMIAQIAQHC